MKKDLKVSNDKLFKKLNESISENSNALDYVENLINKTNDSIKFSNTDEDKYILSRLTYIKFVLQYVLRQILLQGQDMSADLTQVATVSSDSIKMATLVVAVLPILCVYPFVQKYFVKGVMIGAVKG